jgi:hypothetical protein
MITKDLMPFPGAKAFAIMEPAYETRPAGHYGDGYLADREAHPWWQWP